MHPLNISGLFQSLQAFVGLKSRPSPSVIDSEDHSYRRGSDDCRSPCPGLNVLANHGYLPRDGKNISREHIEAGLMAGYNFSHPLATFVSSVIFHNITKPGTTFDLTDLRKHNAIEHDVSLTRHDFSQGDNYTFQPEMFEQLLRDIGNGPATAKSFGKIRRRRTRESEAAGFPKLSLKLLFVAVFNIGSTLLVLGPPGISKDNLTVFFTEERSPLELPLQRHLTLLNYFTQGLRVLWHNYVHLG